MMYLPQFLLLITTLITLNGCNLIQPDPALTRSPTLYQLDRPLASLTPSLTTPATTPQPATAKILNIAPPKTWAGLETPAIRYRQQSYTVGYYAYNHWLAAPVELLWPLIAAELEQKTPFADVTLGVDPQAHYRLELTLESWQYNVAIQPSQWELVLSARLLALPSLQLLAKQRFIVTQPTAQTSADAAVTAANQAVQQLLPQLTAFVMPWAL